MMPTTLSKYKKETIITFNKAEDTVRKICPKCKVGKLLREFGNDSHRRNKKRCWCKDCCSEASRQRRIVNSETYLERARKYRQTHLKACRQRDRDWHERIRNEVLTVYGNGKLACTQCGESRLPCLSIDHIMGGGNLEFKRLKKRGVGFYSWLRKNNFPLGYQTLCMNCQWIKRHLGGEDK